jgi:hypothetical protein
MPLPLLPSNQNQEPTVLNQLQTTQAAGFGRRAPQLGVSTDPVKTTLAVRTTEALGIVLRTSTRRGLGRDASPQPPPRGSPRASQAETDKLFEDIESFNRSGVVGLPAVMTLPTLACPAGVRALRTSASSMPSKGAA